MRNIFDDKSRPQQPLNLQRTTAWVPESRYYGDRYPRTMQEAFGPYAELDVEPAPRRYPGLIRSVLVVLALLAARAWFS